MKKPSVSKSHDIKSMFKMGASKQRKPEKDASIADDELLGDILNDLHSDVRKLNYTNFLIYRNTVCCCKRS